MVTSFSAMVENRENNRTEEIGLFTPAPGRFAQIR